VIVEAIERIAESVQQARDRLGQPLTILRWYCPLNAESPFQPRSAHRHALGDAITFYAEGLTGSQLYWALTPWWPGGLAFYSRYPYLCYVDARRDRVRWQHR
jgi:hypothetical protein